MKNAPGKGVRPSGYRGALQSYLHSIRRYELLTKSGEHRLAVQSRRGVEQARLALIEANLRLAVKIALTYRKYGTPLEDLIAEGNLGLIEAARRFDPERGVRFVSYAAWWIRKFILAALNRQLSQVTAPATRPAPEKGRDAASRYRIVSLEELPEDSSDRPVAERLSRDDEALPEEITLSLDLAERLLLVLPRLPANERRVLVNHFGIGGEPPRTLQEIGDDLGCTRERVRQIERRALERARRILAVGTRAAPLPRRIRKGPAKPPALPRDF